MVHLEEIAALVALILMVEVERSLAALETVVAIQVAPLAVLLAVAAHLEVALLEAVAVVVVVQ
jgi:hypothetical protein